MLNAMRNANYRFQTVVVCMHFFGTSMFAGWFFSKSPTPPLKVKI